jgi:hypothetical protein
LVHRIEVEPQVGEEGKGELEAGVEKKIEEVGPANCAKPSHVCLADVLQRSELVEKKIFKNHDGWYLENFLQQSYRHPNPHPPIPSLPFPS